MLLRRRFSALAVLAAFLAAQAWVVCAVVCLSAGRAQASGYPGTDMPMAMHGTDCHTQGVGARTPLMQQGLSPMLRAEAGILLPVAPLGPHAVATSPYATTVHTPSADPPPPRFA
jgi:hypothetical protein